MAHQWADRVWETSTTTGTGALTLAGAVLGFQRFSAVCSVADTVIYAIEAVDANSIPTGDWEVGVGTYSGTNTLTRTTVIKSSNSNAAVSFAAGTKNVFLDDIAETRNTLQEYTGAQSTNQPSAPVSGLSMWSQDRNGWAVPMHRGVNGISLPVNTFISGRAGWGALGPSPNNATMVPMGSASAVLTNGLAISPAGTNAYTAIARVGANTTATVSSTGNFRSSVPVIMYRGASANSGFRIVMEGGPETVGNTNCRWFFGLISISTATSATFDPAVAGNSLIGIGATGTDTANAKLYYATGAAVNSVDLGANFPAKTAQAGMYGLHLWASGSSASSVNYLVRRLDDSTIAPVTGILSTNLPAAQVMYPHWTINNNATATQSVLACGYAYWETGI